MGARKNFPEPTGAQLQFQFGGQQFPPRAMNDDSPFSAPSPTRSVFNGVLDHRGEKKPKLVRLGLTLRDCVARCGPADGYAE
jgi:hypothetical protein